MGLSKIVTLPKDRLPKFPDRCVICNRPQPNSVVCISDRYKSWWVIFIFAWWPTGEKYSVEIPACIDCVSRYWFYRRLRKATAWVFILAGFILAYNLFSVLPVRRGLRRFLATGIVLVVCSPYILWLLFHPLFVDLTAHRDSVNFEFRDPDYAKEFAALNEVSNEEYLDKNYSEEREE